MDSVKAPRIMLFLFLLVGTINGFSRHVPRNVPLRIMQASQSIGRYASGPLYSTIAANKDVGTLESTLSLLSYLFMLSATPISIVEICDKIDEAKERSSRVKESSKESYFKRSQETSRESSGEGSGGKEGSLDLSEERLKEVSNSIVLSFQETLLNLRRQSLLSTMLKNERTVYLETVRFLGPRIPRNDLPNLQDVPYFNYGNSGKTVKYSDNYENTEIYTEKHSAIALENENQIVNDDEMVQTIVKNVPITSDLLKECSLPNVTYVESPLDVLLLGIFRGFVQKEVGYKSEIEGIKGLLAEGKHYYLSEEGGVTENQHAFVRRTLGKLLTPILPPFYRIFMAGIIPSKERGDPQWLADGTIKIIDYIKDIDIIADNKWVQESLIPGKQLGPLFYAPLLTSIVTPPFLNFLVGPARTNRRKDGELGGIVVEKCKFLQESGCKGLCLHQCKLPAQQFFQDTLGLSLSVIPDFETQACQWSWGEVPLPPESDPAYPKGCLSGCPTRSQMKELDSVVKGGTICNA